MKNFGTALVLTFLLGGFGVHKFYLGKTGQGILYLLFFWTTIPAWIALVEFVIMLAQGQDKFDQQYNK